MPRNSCLVISESHSDSYLCMYNSHNSREQQIATHDTYIYVSPHKPTDRTYIHVLEPYLLHTARLPVANISLTAYLLAVTVSLP